LELSSGAQSASKLVTTKLHVTRGMQLQLGIQLLAVKQQVVKQHGVKLLVVKLLGHHMKWLWCPTPNLVVQHQRKGINQFILRQQQR
jgi:hypothetical protein